MALRFSGIPAMLVVRRVALMFARMGALFLFSVIVPMLVRRTGRVLCRLTEKDC